ncbi:MAG: hypothetical protein D6E12_07365 [Desulfovibrio sp.]|nr:MAG: hypothetical protein D6E12_07365 [Desulfovibrio sp.]
MTDEEKKQITTMAQRVLDVVEVLKGNDAANFSNSDLDDLANLLANIATVMDDMAKADNGS